MSGESCPEQEPGPLRVPVYRGPGGVPTFGVRPVLLGHLLYNGRGALAERDVAGHDVLRRILLRLETGAMVRAGSPPEVLWLSPQHAVQLAMSNRRRLSWEPA